jgi:hypothetical protein
MAEQVKITIKKELTSNEIFSHATKWFFTATFSFVIVVLFHQFLLGGISHILGYQTHIKIGKVESLPHYDVYWSSNRVLLLYAFPGFLLLVLSGILLINMLFGDSTVTLGRWLRFWLMVFCVLMSTTLMTISFFYTLDPANTLFQGFAVLVYWYRMGLVGSITLILLASALNLLFGFLMAPVLFDLMPILIRKRGKSPRSKVMASFFYPIFFIFPIAIAISFPHYHSIFLVMFFLSCLWMPGFYLMNPGTLKRADVMVKPSSPYYVFLFIAITAIIIALIRTYLV